MARRLFLIIVSVIMICGCNPGDPCGPGQIFDCSYDCIDGFEINSVIGDGECNGNLNCSEFEYDDGDCEGVETTTTTINNDVQPMPVKDNSYDVSCDREFTPEGNCIDCSICFGPIRNDGGAGYIFTSGYLTSSYVCAIVWMDAGETSSYCIANVDCTCWSECRMDLLRAATKEDLDENCQLVIEDS